MTSRMSRLSPFAADPQPLISAVAHRQFDQTLRGRFRLSPLGLPWDQGGLIEEAAAHTSFHPLLAPNRWAGQAGYPWAAMALAPAAPTDWSGFLNLSLDHALCETEPGVGEVWLRPLLRPSSISLWGAQPTWAQDVLRRAPVWDSGVSTPGLPTGSSVCAHLQVGLTSTPDHLGLSRDSAGWQGTLWNVLIVAVEEPAASSAPSAAVAGATGGVRGLVDVLTEALFPRPVPAPKWRFVAVLFGHEIRLAAAWMPEDVLAGSCDPVERFRRILTAWHAAQQPVPQAATQAAAPSIETRSGADAQGLRAEAGRAAALLSASTSSLEA